MNKVAAQAAAARLRRQALADFLSDWRATHGPITAAELAKARAELGYPVECKPPPRWQLRTDAG